MSAAEQCRLLRLEDIVAPSGVGYDDEVQALSGRPVVVEGNLQRAHGGQLQLGTAAVSCAHSLPEPTLLLADPAVSLDLVPLGTSVRLLGVLEYGLEVDETGTASYLRLSSARPG